MLNFLWNFTFVIVAMLALIIILFRPYYGLIMTIISLPIIELLPPFPLFSSGIVLIGLATLVGYFLEKMVLRSNNNVFRLELLHILGIIFVIWITLTDFQAAIHGSSRNWMFTFIQLWALLFLAGELLNSSKKQKKLIWFFALTCAITGIISIVQGDIRETVSTSIRASGLSGNPNSNGRYLVTAMIFFHYLRSASIERFLRVIASIGVIITFIAVFFTLSRTSILLLIVTISLFFLFNFRNRISLTSVLFYSFSLIILFAYFDQIITILKTIWPSITQGSDTVGLRYKLWQAAIIMWQDHKIYGVGIGNYPIFLQYYGSALAPRYWNSYPHNTYLTALAETGIVGFGIILGMIVLTYINYFQRQKFDMETEKLRKLWILVFTITLLGAITANGLHDKLLWLIFGISVYFRKNTNGLIDENYQK